MGHSGAFHKLQNLYCFVQQMHGCQQGFHGAFESCLKQPMITDSSI